MPNLTKMAAAIGLVVAVLLGTLAYSVLRTPAEASGPMEAIPLAAGTSAAANPAATPQPSPTTSEADVTTAPATADASDETSVAAATEQPAATRVAATTAAEATTAPAAPADLIVAQIVQEESEARFVIDEVLNDAPKTVVGVTNQIAGEIAVDPSDPTRSRVGVIQVNARGLTTDSEFRNRAIKNRILLTDQFEYITFTPKELVGLPQAGAVGQSYSFQIIGNLTIRDVTREVTFDVTATPASESRLEGTASTTIRYADFGVTIPQVRQVASVADEVRLEIDFVAVPS